MSKEEANIIDFWENKHYYKTPQLLKEKAREFYTEEFINNYSKWSQNVIGLNEAIRAHLQSKNFPMQHCDEMKYDWFCENMNRLIDEWITANGDILVADISIILEKLIADYIAICLSKYTENAHTISTLIDSIKNAFIV